MSLLRRLARQRLREAGAGYGPATFTSFSNWELEPGTRAAIQAVQRQRSGGELVIGRIDNDGRVLCLLGPLPSLTQVSEAEFVKRRRFDLDVVVVEDAVLLRKNYRGDEHSFIHEWLTLAVLSGKVNVPVIHHVDETQCLLYRNLVAGRTIRDLLVAHGARILSVQTENDPKLARLGQKGSLEAVWARGRAVLKDCLSEDQLIQMERQVSLVQKLGVLGISQTYGNVVVEEKTGKPWFIDLDKARFYWLRFSPLFFLKLRRERQQFNSLYGRHLPCRPLPV